MALQIFCMGWSWAFWGGGTTTEESELQQLFGGGEGAGGPSAGQMPPAGIGEAGETAGAQSAMVRHGRACRRPKLPSSLPPDTPPATPAAPR